MDALQNNKKRLITFFCAISLLSLFLSDNFDPYLLDLIIS